MNLFVSLLLTPSEKHEDLAKAFLNEQDKVLELIENIYSNTEMIKDNKMAVLHKYHTIFLGILKTVSQAIREEGSSEGLKPKFKAFVREYFFF